MARTTRIGNLLFIGLLAIAGCTTTVIAPPNPVNPTTVLITDYGRHSSLLLPDADGRMVEYAFGDWQWYALDNHNLITAIFALVHSPQSTLGRRWVTINPDQSDAAGIVGASRIERISLDRDRVNALLQDLDRQYTKHIDTVIFSPAEHLYFVHSDKCYNALNNCNHMTADWLGEMGARIDGPAIFSRFRVEPATKNLR